MEGGHPLQGFRIPQLLGSRLQVDMGHHLRGHPGTAECATGSVGCAGWGSTPRDISAEEEGSFRRP